MELYLPDILMYYYPDGEDVVNSYKITPAADISINLEYKYSNDNIIGYIYVINLNGNACAISNYVRGLNYGDEYNIGNVSAYNLGAVVDEIEFLRNLLLKNGSTLEIVNASNGQSLLKAHNGILRSLSFDESTNNWSRSANYQATIEFTDIFYNGTKSQELFLNLITENNIVDINEYRIKDFNDSWSISFDDNTSYNSSTIDEETRPISINNHSFNISYNISAVGQTIYKDGIKISAFEQAKNFVQHKLHNQIKGFLANILKVRDSITGSDYTQSSCDASKDGLDNIHFLTDNDGLLHSLTNDSDDFFDIFNETITCDSSKSAGSFSATYSAIVKTKKNTETYFSSKSTIHTFNKSINKTYNTGATETKIIISGSIKGLMERGLRGDGPLILPDVGTFLVYTPQTTSKYSHAVELLNNIIDKSNRVGSTGKQDLTKAFKDFLGITSEKLGPGYNSSIEERLHDPHPISFNLTHDYNGGIINYTVEYTNNNFGGRKYRELTVQTTMPTKVVALFNIPNSNSVPVLQDLGTTTAKTVNISVQGIDLGNTQHDLNSNLYDYIIGAEDPINPGNYPISLPSIPNNSIITQQQLTKNIVDGTYSISLTYTCCPVCQLG